MSFKFNAIALSSIESVVLADAGRARAVASAIATLRPMIAGQSPDSVRDAIIAQYAKVAGFETIIVAKGTHAGRVGWPEGAAAQKKACQRFMAELFADESVAQSKPTKGEYETPAELLSKALELVQLAAEYGEDLQKVLASQAVADAWVAIKKA
jgi:hypothetical protein